jgi:hypothetical protein
MLNSTARGPIAESAQIQNKNINKNKGKNK